jgi:hypothetical protein
MTAYLPSGVEGGAVNVIYAMNVAHYPAFFAEEIEPYPALPKPFADAIRELGRLQVNWDGEGGLAPSDATLRSFATAVRALPSAAALPEIEVDGTDGSITTRWYAADHSQAFSLTACEADLVGVLTSKDGGPRGWKYSSSNERAIARALVDVGPLLTNG